MGQLFSTNVDAVFEKDPWLAAERTQNTCIAKSCVDGKKPLVCACAAKKCQTHIRKALTEYKKVLTEWGDSPKELKRVQGMLSKKQWTGRMLEPFLDLSEVKR